MVSTSESTASATADTQPSSNDVAGSSGASAQDQERLTKLGVLLVNVGAASEEKVFGVKGSAPMRTYENHTMTDLLVINRREDDAAAHPFHWYKPWTWWTSGPQVSPMVRVAAALAASLPPSSTSSSAPPSAAVAASGTQTEETDIPLPPVVEPKVKAKKKKGLPTVDMRPLTDAEVALLTPAVQADRTKLLKSEENIHKALQKIEDARYRYLVPARDLHCEAEVVAVVRCYAERHRVAADKEQSAAVRADLLACGPDVQRLKKCAEAMTMAYSHDGEAA